MSAAGTIRMTPERLKLLRRTFNDSALERLTVASQDYYSKHGHYVPALADLLLAEKAEWKADYQAALDREAALQRQARSEYEARCEVEQEAQQAIQGVRERAEARTRSLQATIERIAAMPIGSVDAVSIARAALGESAKDEA